MVNAETGKTETNQEAVNETLPPQVVAEKMTNEEIASVVEKMTTMAVLATKKILFPHRIVDHRRAVKNLDDEENVERRENARIAGEVVETRNERSLGDLRRPRTMMIVIPTPVVLTVIDIVNESKNTAPKRNEKILPKNKMMAHVGVRLLAKSSSCILKRRKKTLPMKRLEKSFWST